MADLTERVHELKVWPEFFEELLAERKTFEIRHDDRGYKVGDTLWLREWVPDRVACDGGGYTGRECRRVITYTTTWEQKPNYVVLALRSVRQEPVADEQDIFDAVAEYRAAMETVAVPRRELEWLARQDPQSGLTVGLASDAVESAKRWLAAPPSASVEQARREALEEALQRIAQWADAYPPDIFPPMTDDDWKTVRTALQPTGITLDRVSADNMRHVVDGVGEIARSALAQGGKPSPVAGTEGGKG